MKNKVLRRCLSMMIVLVTYCANVTNVFAMSLQNESDFMEKNELVKANSGVSTWVSSNGSAELSLNLESYIGLSKNFIVNATSDSTTGGLFLYLYNPKGELVSKDWMMGINETVKWNVFLPASGTWRLRVVASGTNNSVYVFARWE